VMAIILNVLLLLGGGVLMLYLGVHAVLNLDGDVGGAPSRGANFSIAFGALAVVMSLLFTLGFKKKPKQPCVCFVQFLLLLFLGVFASMFGMIFVTEDVVDGASGKGFDVAQVSSRDADVLLKLYVQFERLYNNCRPGDHGNALWANAFSAPAAVDTSCVANSGWESFGTWGQASCLGSADGWTAVRTTTLSSCHANLRAHHYYNVSAHDNTRAAWLFCACAQAVPGWFDGEGMATQVKLAMGVAFGLVFLLFVLSCVLTKAFKKKKKKKKKKKDKAPKREGASLLSDPSGTEMARPIINHNTSSAAMVGGYKQGATAAAHGGGGGGLNSTTI